MNAHFVDAWWSWVLQAGWQSAIVGGVLLLVVACGKRWPAPVRYALLMIALLKFAAPPFWSSPTGLFSQFSVANRPSASALFAGQNSRLDPASGSAANSSSADAHEQSNESGRTPRLEQAALPLGNSDAEARSLESKINPATVRPIGNFAALSSLKVLLLTLHLGGAVALLVWVAREFLSIRRLTTCSQAIKAGPIRESMERIRGRHGLGLHARVLTSTKIAAPLATGVWPPTVILPESAEGLEPRELDAILLHELTHLRRGDSLLVWLQVVLCAVWWFHPVIWLVNRSVRRVREDYCDDSILLSGIATESEYCEMLLRVAQAASNRRTDVLACQMADRLHPLGQRLRRIMDGRVRRSRRMSTAALAIVALLAAAVLPGLRASAQIPRPANELGGDHRAAKAQMQTVPAPPADPFALRLRESMNRARAYLAGTQNQDGSFSGFSNNENVTVLGAGTQPRPGENQIVGTTSLAILALLSSGMSPDDPVIVKGVEFLSNSPRPERFFFTYQASLEIAALVAAKQGDRDRERIAALVHSLADNQIKTGYRSGMWGYEPRISDSDGDNSNTEFAIMGLSAGEVAGVIVDRSVWARSADHYVNSQNQDRGWGYHQGAASTGTMTAAAIASLEVCRQKLAATEHPRLSACEIAIKRGLAWQDRYFQAGTNPGQGNTWLMLYWVQVGRAGRLAGRKQFGRHEWFREIAEFALTAQSARDGSWKTWGGPESNARLGTSFVLLFLGDGLPGDTPGPATRAE